MCYDKLCKLGYGDNFEFDIFYKNDNIKVSDGNIYDRIFEVRPQYMDDFTIDGDTISETDRVQFQVHHPNGSINTIYDRCDNMAELQEALINWNYIDHNCTVDIHDDECHRFDVKDGNLITPATIIK